MSLDTLSYQIDVIGIIHSPYNDKFAIPRQAALNSVVTAEIELLAPYNCDQAIEGLDQVSHLWIEFIFHEVPEENTKIMVRPPRLGGNKKIGVLASRSPFRKNRLGLSVVKLEAIKKTKGSTVLIVSGVDMLNLTPVVDIKPYLPYADNVTDAEVEYVTENSLKKYHVAFSDEVLNVIGNDTILQQELVSILRFDPRPAYASQVNNIFKFTFRKYDMVCCIELDRIILKQMLQVREER